MWKSTSDAVRSTDRASFFVRDKYFDQLSAADIVAHDAGHVNNALSKISRVTDARLHGFEADVAVLGREVVPDLWIYGFQLANAYGHEVVAAYAGASGISLAAARTLASEADLIDAQAAIDVDALPGELWASGQRDLMATLAYERFSMSFHAISLTRVADKADHGVVIDAGRVAFEASGCFLVAAVRLAHASGTELGAASAARLLEIRDKYGVLPAVASE